MVPDRKTLQRIAAPLLQARDPLARLDRAARILLGAALHPDTDISADPLAVHLLSVMRKHPMSDVLGPLYLHLAEGVGADPGFGCKPQSITDITAAHSLHGKPWRELPGIVYIVSRGGGSGADALSSMKIVAREAPPADWRRIQIVSVDPDPTAATLAAAQIAWQRRWHMPRIGASAFCGTPEADARNWTPLFVAPCQAMPAPDKPTSPPAPPPVGQQLSLAI